MDGDDGYVVCGMASAVGLVAVWFCAPAVVAERKGYKGEPWLLASGVLGVVALAFFPPLRRDGSDRRDPAARRWRRRADHAGVALTALQVGAVAAACLAAFLRETRFWR